MFSLFGLCFLMYRIRYCKICSFGSYFLMYGMGKCQDDLLWLMFSYAYNGIVSVLPHSAYVFLCI